MPYQLKEDLKITLREYLEEKRKRLFPERKPLLTATQKDFFKRTPSNKLPFASHTIRENREFFSQVIKKETDHYLYRVNQSHGCLD